MSKTRKAFFLLTLNSVFFFFFRKMLILWHRVEVCNLTKEFVSQGKIYFNNEFHFYFQGEVRPKNDY